MKIAFDCRYVRTDHHDGISRFSARLVEQLAPLASARGDQVIMLISDLKQLTMLPELPYELISSPTSIREPRVAHQINKFGPDIVFSPMQTIGSRGRKYKLVLTVHDLIYYSHPTPPRQFAWPLRLLWRLYHLSWLPQKMLLAKSDAIVAVSATTKSLILKSKLATKPVYVVHNAADQPVKNPVVVPADQRSRSVVYMGSFMPYKNVETLVRAIAALPDFTLHLLSRISDVDRKRLSGINPQAQIHFHNGTTDEDYFDLLTHATALVSASRDEGFGIPLVESMSLGTPIVVSDIPIFHEIGGDAALFASPDQPEEFAEAIESLTNPQKWQQVSNLSRTQAQKFSWKKSAQDLLDVLVKVAGS
ncbi:glycosyltransferase family 4 protein [Aurantimicrobium minutum]|uniref:glycosyltransferase family 4 protein n=1 Tax=Aurantimicrobium minutum TaxID=708131 RepID=UPI002476CBC1|nr:glycosyltransferase family 1 protein [Aurantimicrobium minutum]MDH6422656.1 glycosyltransferase involved in cell wall biosynthesis [Aurantimicrobium minutum]